MKFFTRTSSFLVLSSLLAVVTIDIAERSNTTAVHAGSTYQLAQDTESAEQPLVVIAYLQVKPEHRQTFLDLANTVVEQTNETEEGSSGYGFYENQEDTPNLFFFFEEWKSRAAFEEHLEKTYTKSLTDKYPEILAEPADVRIYDIEGIEQLQIP